MPWRRQSKPPRTTVLHDTGDAQKSLQRAEKALESVNSREALVKEIADYLRSRRRENHLGEDFTITLNSTRRRNA